MIPPKPHAVRLHSYHSKLLERLKKQLTERKYQGRAVSTAKAVEFLLDVFKELEQHIVKVFLPEPDALAKELLGNWERKPTVERLQENLSKGA